MLGSPHQGLASGSPAKDMEAVGNNSQMFEVGEGSKEVGERPLKV